MQINTRSAEAIKKVKYLGLIGLIRAKMKYSLFNVSMLNKVLIKQAMDNKGCSKPSQVHLRHSNVRYGYDIHQAGDQSVIHLNPLRRTKRHVAEIVSRAVNLSTSPAKYTVVHSDYCVNDRGTQSQSGIWQSNEVSPAWPPFPGSLAERERCWPLKRATTVIEPSEGRVQEVLRWGWERGLPIINKKWSPAWCQSVVLPVYLFLCCL